jgi:hypothetical protein
MWQHMTNIVDLAPLLGFESRRDIDDVVSAMELLAKFGSKIDEMRRQGLN